MIIIVESRNNSKAKSNFLAPIAQRSRAIKEKQEQRYLIPYTTSFLPALNLIGRDNIFSARFCPFQTARVNLPRKFHWRRPVSVSTPFPKISNRAEVTRNRKRVILGRGSLVLQSVCYVSHALRVRQVCYSRVFTELWGKPSYTGAVNSSALLRVAASRYIDLYWV